MRLLLLLLVTLGALLGLAGPASAHAADAQGVDADYLTTLTAVPSGLSASVVEGGSRLELRLTGASEAVVLGEAGEPFLRLRPDGVELNEDSPYAWRTLDRRGITEVPVAADRIGDPRWKRVSDTPVAIYHEHRMHWTGLQPPAEVAAAPDQVRRLRDWSVPVLVDGAPMALTGTLDYLPGPSPWPWLPFGLTALIAIALALRGRGFAIAACLLVVVADVVRTLGQGLAAADGTVGAIASAAGVASIGWVLLLLACVGAWRRQVGALVLAAVGGALVALAGGLPEIGVLGASLPLTAWPDVVQRAAVTVSIGGGLGLLVGLVGAFSRLSPPVVQAALPPDPAEDLRGLRTWPRSDSPNSPDPRTLRTLPARSTEDSAAQQTRIRAPGRAELPVITHPTAPTSTLAPAA